MDKPICFKLLVQLIRAAASRILPMAANVRPALQYDDQNGDKYVGEAFHVSTSLLC